MSFPTDNDIQRVIDMQSSDCGFFVLAIYAFIEKYMKSEISYFGGDDDSDAGRTEKYKDRYVFYRIYRKSSDDCY